MVSRLIPPAIALSLVTALFAGTAQAATTSPKPVASSKPTAKPTATKKPVPNPTATKKPVAKKPVVKKPVIKRKIVTVAPTPKVVWPPKGFRANGEIFARVPTAAELLAILSADKTLTLVAKQCIKKACGVVRVASSKGCTWWEILSTVSGPTSSTDSKIIVRGNLRTTAKSTMPKQIITVYLVSNEPLTPKTSLGGLAISCYHSPVSEKIPSNSYLPTVSATPIETPSPTPSETPSVEPTPTATSG